MAGAVVALVVRGEGPSTLQDVREWSARTLRAMEHHGERRPETSGSLGAPTLATVTPVTRPRSIDAPCPVDTGPEDPCAELLAPFLTKGAPVAQIPTFPFESLPRVRPVVARRARVHTAPAPLPRAPDADQEDDAQSTPAAKPPKSDDALTPRSVPFVAVEQTAENDLR